LHKSLSLAGFESAEKNLQTKILKEDYKDERPNPMRPRLVDQYINGVLNNQTSEPKNLAGLGSKDPRGRIEAIE
jgi:hypothetical protein